MRARGGGAQVHADVGPDPAQVFWGLRLRGATSQTMAARGTDLDVPRGWTPSSIEAIDEHGNVIDQINATSSVPPRAPGAATPEPIYRRWGIWALAAGGALVIAGIGAEPFRCGAG